MSLLKTKPTWHNGEVIATDRGWVCPKKNEVLVSIGNLKNRLIAEGVLFDAPEVVVIEPLITLVVEPKPVVAELVAVTEVIQKRTYAPRKPKVTEQEDIMESKDVVIVAEVTEQKLESKQQIIAEVVEHVLDKQIISE